MTSSVSGSYHIANLDGDLAHHPSHWLGDVASLGQGQRTERGRRGHQRPRRDGSRRQVGGRVSIDKAAGSV